MAPAAVPVNASVASTGLGIRYVGEQAYGFSGGVIATNSVTPITMLKFTSGAKVLKVFFQYFDNTDSSVRRWQQLTLNGEVVLANSYDGTPENGGHGIYYNAIIPPLTEVEFGCNMVSASGDRTMYVTMTGRAYGV